MKNVCTGKVLLAVVVAAALFGAGVVAGAGKFGTPSTILHVVTLKWKVDATEEQKQAALDGVKKMAAEIPGIKNVWIKTVRVQPRDYSAVFAIEFEDKAAADRYAGHPAHQAWEKIYLPVRQESRSHQATN